MKVFWLFFLFPLSAMSFEIPTGLTQSDRQKIIKELGIPASSKFLSNPYPLGGYVGFEVGLSYQAIDIQEISSLADKAESNDESLSIVGLSIGKGLYNDVDLYFNFAPFNHSDNINSYGGLLKWGLYQAKFLPINFSILAMGNVFHVSDSFVNQSFGLEVMAGVNVENLSIYFGSGQLQGEGQFMGGQNGVVDGGGPTVKQQEKLTHFFLGINIQSGNFFISAQMDNYKDTSFSGKLGLRF